MAGHSMMEPAAPVRRKRAPERTDMPSPRKKSNIDTDLQPIEAIEIAAMFREASSQGPYPSEEQAALIAEVLNSAMSPYIAGGRLPVISRRAVVSRDAQRAKDAARLILRHLEKHSHAFSAPILHELYQILPRAIPLLDPFPRREAQRDEADQPWASSAGTAALVCNRVLSELGRRSGTSRDSVTVRFVVAATRRMGFPGVDAGPVARLLVQMKRNSDQTAPGEIRHAARPPSSPHAPDAAEQTASKQGVKIDDD